MQLFQSLPIQSATEDTVLNPRPIAFEDFCHLAQALGITDVIGNEMPVFVRHRNGFQESREKFSGGEVPTCDRSGYG
jgi:hypothetical protein